MGTSTIRVVCDCGKEFRVSDDPTGRLSIRCHLCGHLVDVPFRKAAIVDAQAKREAEAKRQRITRAEEMDYAGLRFDGVYRTSSPIVLDSHFGETLSLSLHFRRDLTVHYHLAYKDAAESEVQEESGPTDYELCGESKIRFSFDTGWWETEWEGILCDEQLRLTFRMEMYVGLSQGPLCVVEDEATALFVPSANNA